MIARLLLCTLLLAGCREKRKPIVRVDAGPSVVVVDPLQKRPGLIPLVEEKEPDDGIASAQPLEAGKGIRGTLAAPRSEKGKLKGDEDFYTWTQAGGGDGPDGGFLEARVRLVTPKDVDLAFEVLDGDGKKMLAVNDAPAGEEELLPNLAVTPGNTYYIKVRAAQPPKEAAAESKPYELTVETGGAQPGAEREPNDDSAHATPLAAMADATGFFGKKRDEDWLLLPIAVETGTATVRMELSPIEGVAAQLRVLTKSGKDEKILAAARASKGEELRLRNVDVPAGGGVLVALKALEGRNTENRWLLKVGVEPPLDGVEHEPNDTVQNATAATVEQTLSGFLWPGDADVFCVADDGTRLIAVEVEGVDRVDLRLERMSKDGKAGARADEGGAGKGELLSPAVPGCVRVSARAKDTAFDAPYRISFRGIAKDPDLEREPNDTMAQATAIPDGTTTMRGYAAPKGDEDWFRFTAPAGKTKVTATAQGAGLSYTVRLSDEGKAPLGPATGTGSAGGAVVAGKPYFASVKSDKSNPRDSYTLTLVFE